VDIGGKKKGTASIEYCLILIRKWNNNDTVLILNVYKPLVQLISEPVWHGILFGTGGNTVLHGNVGSRNVSFCTNMCTLGPCRLISGMLLENVLQ
jgi:hypothetical protein